MGSTYSFYPKQALKQRIDRGYLLQISLVFIAYVVAGKLGQATANIRSSNLGPVWPAYGIALAAILICGYRVWFGVAAGAFVVAFFSPVPHVAALGQAAATTLAATTGTFLLRRIAKFDNSLYRLSDVLTLIAVGGFGSALVSASIGVLVLYATHVHAYSGLGAAWLIYWLGDATGVLLVTPLALRFTDVLKLRKKDRIGEIGILFVLLVGACFVIFSDLRSIPIKLDVMAFAVLPFIMWAAIRFGLGVTAFSILIVAAIATVGTALGSGPFTSNTTFVNAVLLDVFFGVLSVSGLSLAAVISEREQAESEREHVVSKQASLEARLEAAYALRISEERWRLAAHAGKMYAYEWDVATDAVVRSGEVSSILGPAAEGTNLTRQKLVARVHPEDRALFIASATKRTPENPDWQIRYRIVLPDGSIKWLEKTAHALFDRHGKMLRVIGMVMDITDRRQAEEALANMSRKLMEAQEQERTRIARELHDDINQRLALLSAELEGSRHNPPDSAADVSLLLTGIRERINEISSDVQSLSHQLHSSQLEYLGIVAATRSFCREFSASQDVEIDFNHDEIPTSVSPEVSLCLFRILQEALHNAVKYSKVRHFDVRLSCSENQLRLKVSDRGVGFDPESAMSRGGLGLTSMKERVRLISGTISIESKPMHGTTIHVRVPVTSEDNSGEVAV
jgi:PAS domain S-box-containing protein